MNIYTRPFKIPFYDFSGNNLQLVIKYPDGYQTEQFLNNIKLNPDGSYKMIYIGQYVVVPNKRLCIVNPIVPTSTRSSNIPGPEMFIILDMNVPLYNYSKNNSAYSELITADNAPWHNFTNHDIIIPSNVISNLVVLKIDDAINNNITTYNLTIPVGIFIYGAIDPSIPIGTNIQHLNNSVYINSIKLLVYYNSQLVPLQQTPVITYPKELLTFDVSYNKVSNSDMLVVFSYIGNINVSNLLLNTYPGFVYSIKLYVDIGYNQIYNVNADYPIINYNLIANPSSINKITNINCNITSTPTAQPLSEFLLSTAT
jgi:hypothetical protein